MKQTMTFTEYFSYFYYFTINIIEYEYNYIPINSDKFR